MNRGEKFGQMKISFGMIFSIILIIAFIALAIYGVLWFLDTQKSAKVGIFYDTFQKDVDSLWRGTYGSVTHTYNLPSDIEYVCIWLSDYEIDKNLKFYPEDHGMKIKMTNISHINMDRTISAANKQINSLNNFPSEYSEYKALCIENKKEKVAINLTKGYGERSVTISRG